ncbi:MAG UNVERIFIED_CONTAM: ATP synthase F1 subunit epsilon [Rickettsiaceae bacterium]|jgi:F-type H+-transporting ATPase subunit epsilon
MQLRIISCSKIEYQDDVDMVILPGEDGEFGILPQHMEMMASLQAGTIRIHKQDKEDAMDIKGGIVTIEGNKIDVIIQSIAACTLSMPDEGKDIVIVSHPAPSIIIAKNKVTKQSTMIKMDIE